MPTHKIAIRRAELGLEIADVAILSGVSETTIRRIEAGNMIFKINFTTAQALAYGLDTPVHTLFDGAELSDLGRPALTGTPTKQVVMRGAICIGCRVEMPLTGTCPTCHH